MNQQSGLKQAVKQSAKAMWRSLPILLGVILLVSLFHSVIPKSAFVFLFSKNIVLDSFIGSAIGSFLAGNPVTSYILGGELLSQGISLTAVTAFLVSWVSVGVVQLPAESILLGKKFAIIRNITAFLFAVVVAILTVLILGVI
ncbi:permease [Candidatus Woesearchaeota archaeon]|nr:permease [Candidatus Woesearchaeota archaeon]